MKKTTLLAAGLMAGLASTASAQSTLKLLHASDLEGGLDALNRAANFGAIIETLEDSSTLIVSAGDNYIPGPFFNAAGDFSFQPVLQDTYEQLFGEPVGSLGQVEVREGAVDITIMNIIGFDASAVGNHEFDGGSEIFRDLIEEELDDDAVTPDKSDIVPGEVEWFGAQFPYLSANLDFSGDSALSGVYTPDILPNTAYTYTPAEAIAKKFATAQGASTKIAPATTVLVDGEIYGVVGGTTQNVGDISSPTGTVDRTGGAIDIPALAAVIQPVIDDLEAAGVNKIIVVTHLQQLSREEELATLLSGVDIIIAGGSDTLLANPGTPLNPGDSAAGAYPVVTANADGEPVYIVSTDGEYSYVGQLVANFDAAGVLTGFDPVSGPIATENPAALAGLGFADYDALKAATTRDDLIQGLVDGIQNIIIAKDATVYGETTVFLEGRRSNVRTEETNFGNLSADANLAAAKAFDSTVQVSLKNGGGIRNQIGEIVQEDEKTLLLPPAANPLSGKLAGQISQLDIENTLRFNNQLSLLTLTAQGLVDILEYGVADSAPGNTPGRFPQVAGLSFAFDFDASPRVRSLSLKDAEGYTTDVIVEDGVLLGDPSREIRIVTLNFLAGGGDGYPFPALGSNRVDTGIGEQQALADYLVANHGIGAGTPFRAKEVGPGFDGRIQNLGFRSDTANYPAIVDPTTPKLSLLGTYQGLVFDEGAAEIVAYDAGTQKLFAVNADAATVDILSLADPSNPVKVDEIDVAGDFAESDVEIGPNSVAVHDGLVAVAVERVFVDPVTGDEDQLPGRIALYDTDGVLQASAPAGYLPDMITFALEGAYVLTANEGEPGDTTDPEGSVTVHEIATGKTRQVGFDKFNGRRDKLIKAGVRILNDSATVAEDLEPEYIAVDPTSGFAYVACQEANAFVVVNIKGASAIRVVPLGFKDWSAIPTGFDASDRDGAINLQPWPAAGMYQPDTVKYFEVDGRRFIITAGEGDARDDDDGEDRVKDLNLDPAVFPQAGLQDNEALGRLEVSRVNSDPDGDGLAEILWTYGSRSFSLFEIRNNGKKGLRLAYDSGSELELNTAALLPAFFNSDNDENDSFDSRSDAKGPEPEAVDTGVVDGRTYAFIGLERVGGVMVYEVSDPDAPAFVQYVNNRDFTVEDVEDDLAAVGDLGPECVLFIPAADSPNGKNLLVVSNEISGSVSTYTFE
jgi:alkaline phosphatase